MAEYLAGAAQMSEGNLVKLTLMLVQVPNEAPVPSQEVSNYSIKVASHKFVTE